MPDLHLNIPDPDRFTDYLISLAENGYELVPERTYEEVYLQTLPAEAAHQKIAELGKRPDDVLLPSRIARRGVPLPRQGLEKTDRSAFLRFADLKTAKDIRKFANRFGYLDSEPNADYEAVDDWFPIIEKMRSVTRLYETDRANEAIDKLNLELPETRYGAYITQPESILRYFSLNLRGALFTQAALAVSSGKKFKRCEVCNSQFIARRKSRETCSDSCRTKRWADGKAKSHKVRPAGNSVSIRNN